MKVTVSCDQCQMLSINGVACHETGCPNMGARWDRADKRWVKQRECFECGCTVDADDPCCNRPEEDECTCPTSEIFDDPCPMHGYDNRRTI